MKYTPLQRVLRLITSVLDPRIYAHGIRMLHYYGYTHVRERPKLTLGKGVRIAPNVSFTHAERISIGDEAQIGARCSVWAGKTTGRISIGTRTTLGPDVFVTAADYGLAAGERIVDQEMIEADVVNRRGLLDRDQSCDHRGRDHSGRRSHRGRGGCNARHTCKYDCRRSASESDQGARIMRVMLHLMRP